MALWRNLRVDRIAITVVVGKDLYTFALSQLYGFADIKADLFPGWKLAVIKDKYSRRLEFCPEYHSSKKNRRIADITLGANILFDVGTLHRYFTLTLYPSQFRAEEFKNLKEKLEILLPEFNYKKLYQTGMVSYFELAADSLSQKHHSFLPYRKYTKTSKIWKESNGHLGTTYIGSSTSALRFRVYDKCKELLDKGKVAPFKGLPHTRIEAAKRRLGVAPADLIKMENPFVKLRVADLADAKAASQEKDWQDFIVESLTVGVPQALSNRPTKRKKYMAMLDAVQAPWWRPKFLWLGLPQALAAIAP